MLPIFPDELLHSYLLRVLISYGMVIEPKDIEGIISSAGVIRNDITLTEAQCSIFSELPVSILIAMLENNIPFFGHAFYSNPKSIPAQCGRIFFHRETGVSEGYFIDNNVNVASSYRLFFCPSCIREQIKNYGAGYLKLSWLNNRICEEHGLSFLPLKSNLCRCKLSIFEQLVTVFSGICFQCRRDQEIGSEISVESLSHIKPNRVVTTYAPLLVVPVSFCFMHSFHGWVKIFNKKFGEKSLNEILNIDQQFLRALSKLSSWERGGKQISTAQLFEILWRLEMHFYSDYCEFIDTCTEIIKIDCSDCVPMPLFVEYQVAKNRDCATCPVNKSECPLKF